PVRAVLRDSRGVLGVGVLVGCSWGVGGWSAYECCTLTRCWAVTRSGAPARCRGASEVPGYSSGLGRSRCVEALTRFAASAGGTTAELGRGLTGHPGEGAGEGGLVVEPACGGDLGDRGRGGGQRLGGPVDARPQHQLSGGEVEDPADTSLQGMPGTTGHLRQMRN